MENRLRGLEGCEINGRQSGRCCANLGGEHNPDDVVAQRRLPEDSMFQDFAYSNVLSKTDMPLLLPRTFIEAAKRERKAKPEQCDTDKDESLAASPPPRDPTKKWHLIFQPDAIKQVMEDAKHADRDRLKQCEQWAERMRRWAGMRVVSDIPEQLDKLAEAFPNFRAAIHLIEALAALHRNSLRECTPEGIVLVGVPGIGKTYFVEAFASLAGIDFTSVSLGASQGNFELTGTAQHWASSFPGRVWQLLAGSDFANSVLLLDEIDKCHGDERYSTSNALLDLLEPRTAQRFRDQAVDIEFNASMLWKIATANSLKNIPAPIRSRLEPFSVAPPTEMQLRRIYLLQWRDLVADLAHPPKLSRAVVRHLAAKGQSPRVAQRQLRIALGHALRDKRGAVVDIPDTWQDSNSRPIGFVHGPESLAP